MLYCYRKCKTFFKDTVWENNILSSQKQPALKQKHIVYISARLAFQHFRLVLTKPGSCCVCSTMPQQTSRQAYANMSGSRPSCSFPHETPSYTCSHYFYSSVKLHICTLKLNFHLLFWAGIASLYHPCSVCVFLLAFQREEITAATAHSFLASNH